MKKYIALFAFTSIIIAGMLYFSARQSYPGTLVSVYEVRPTKVTQTVTCSGRIEAAESEDVYVDIPCVADRVFVSAGDEVKKGDTLFTVDVKATKQVIAAAAGVSSAMITDDRIKEKITSPVSGKIRSINVSPGKTVDSQSPCAMISSGDALLVKVAIQESKLKDIKVGQPAKISGIAFEKEEYSGVVSQIASSARQQYVGTITETVVDAVITLTEKDESLKPGLSAKSVIVVGEQQNCIVIPYEYVMQDEENKEYVYLYNDGYCIKRIIQTGKEFSGGYEILSGIAEGDRVIQNPDKITKQGERVRLKP